MKKTLVFRAMYVIEMPDITETTPVYQDLLAAKIESVIDSAPDGWLLDLEDVWSGDVTEWD